jgi:hypothetical protein
MTSRATPRATACRRLAARRRHGCPWLTGPPGGGKVLTSPSKLGSEALSGAIVDRRSGGLHSRVHELRVAYALVHQVYVGPKREGRIEKCSGAEKPPAAFAARRGAALRSVAEGPLVWDISEPPLSPTYVESLRRELDAGLSRRRGAFLRVLALAPGAVRRSDPKAVRSSSRDQARRTGPSPRRLGSPNRALPLQCSCSSRGESAPSDLSRTSRARFSARLSPRWFCLRVPHRQER